MIIYKTTNLINNKIYIGKDEKNNPNYLGSGIIFKKALKKYGRINFKKEILESCNNLDYLYEREIYWIEKLNARDPNIGYNIASGGKNCKINELPNFEEIKKKMLVKNKRTFLEKYGEERSKEIIERTVKTQKERKSIVGDKNPSKRPEVAKKISDGNKKYMSEHPEASNRFKEYMINNKGKTLEEMHGKETADYMKKRSSETKIGHLNPSKRSEVIDKIREKRLAKIEGKSKTIRWIFTNLITKETFQIGFGKLKLFCQNHNLSLAKIKYRLSISKKFEYDGWFIGDIG